MNRDADLLFGILAMRSGFLARDAFLSAVASWAARPDTSLLAGFSASMSEVQRRAIGALVVAQVQTFGQSASGALASLALEPDLIQSLLGLFLPPDLHATVVALPLRGAPSAEGRYRLGMEIGRGGLGRVLEATDAQLEREVAVKLVVSEMPDQMAERFTREAKLTAKLDHPHIVPVHDFGEISADGGLKHLFLCMKRIHGQDLGALIDGLASGDEGITKKYSRARLLAVFQDICLGVAYAHSKNIIHRDLKPSNVMIGEFGETLVVDWGLAKVIGEKEHGRLSKISTRLDLEVAAHTATVVPDARRSGSSTLTVEGDVLGTPSYMSPEQADGKLVDMDARSDIFSLGAILYEILTLRPPFTGDTIEAILDQVLGGQVVPPSVRLKDLIKNAARTPIPPELDAICLKAMAFKKEDRYASALDIHHDVQLFLEGVRERERLEKESLKLSEEGAKHKARYGELIAEIEEAKKVFQKLMAETDMMLPMSERRHVFDAETRIQALEAERIDAFSRANGAYTQALALNAHLPEALDGKCELFLQRYLEAEKKRDRTEMLYQWNVLAQYDRAGEFRKKLKAPGRLTVRTWVYDCDCLKKVKSRDWKVEFTPDTPVAWSEGRPRPDLGLNEKFWGVPRVTTHPGSAHFGHRPGCRRRELAGVGISAARYEEKDYRFVLGPDTLIGKAPLAGVSMERGSWRLTLTPPAGTDLAPAHLPVRIDRDGHWEQDVTLYPAADMPPGFCYVPGGPYQAGEVDGDAARVVRTTEDFFIAKHHVTCREYLDFLNDLAAHDHLEEARSRIPRGGDRAYFVEEKGKFRLPTTEEDKQLEWSDRWPVFAVNWHDAMAYAAWRSRKDGRLYTLAAEDELEKAARGVDDRTYPWGDRHDPTFTHSTRAREGRLGPVEVGSHPVDESVYGVRDTAGNVQSWGLNSPQDRNRDWRAVRGGGWSLSNDASRCGRRSGLLATARRWFIGFRLVMRASEWPQKT